MKTKSAEKKPKVEKKGDRETYSDHGVARGMGAAKRGGKFTKNG